MLLRYITIEGFITQLILSFIDCHAQKLNNNTKTKTFISEASVYGFEKAKIQTFE